MEPTQPSEAMFFTGENEDEIRAFLADVTDYIVRDHDEEYFGLSLFMSVSGSGPSPQKRLKLRAGHFVIKRLNWVGIAVPIASVSQPTDHDESMARRIDAAADET